MFNLNKGKNPKTNEPFVDPIKSKWFNDVNFRRAVAYAINREAMITNLSRGLAQTQNSPVSVPSPYFSLPNKDLKFMTISLKNLKRFSYRLVINIMLTSNY